MHKWFTRQCAVPEHNNIPIWRKELSELTRNELETRLRVTEATLARSAESHNKLTRELKKMQEQQTPIVDIQQQIDHLRSLLTTPNLSQATIDEINTNLQELLRMQRTPRFEKPMEVWHDEK